MKHRSSKKDDRFQTLRAHDHSISTASPVKTSIQRQNTCTHFRKQKPFVELPKIYPIPNIVRQRRYLESCKQHENTIFNLIGTKFNRKNSSDKKYSDEPNSASDVRRGVPLLERQETHKRYFLQSILASNGISKITFQKKQKLKVFIDEGNNSRLINELIRRRNTLKIVNNRQDANILWTQNCDWEHSNTGSTYTESFKTQREMTCHSSESSSSGFQMYKIDESVHRSTHRKFREVVVSRIFIHNHLRSHYQISDKKSLFKNIKKYCLKQKINENDIIPLTYHVERSLDNLPEDLCSKTETWIVKPGEDTNRGNGISVQIGRENIVKAVKQLASSGKSALVQQYIDPLLYKNRKFDIRCYALVTSHCGQLKAYWYREGYLRTCCKQFNNDPTNIYGHLTNDAVQKKHKDYGKYQPCNKLSYSDLEILLKSKDISFDATINKMKELGKTSIKAAEDKLRGEKNIFSFEVFGYDFLIDSKGKVWLIEINTNPCLEFAGSLLSRIIWHMMENSLAIALDPLLLDLPETYNSWKEKLDKIYDDNKFECII